MATPTNDKDTLKATWHGEHPTRVKTEVMGAKVDVKPGKSVQVSREIGKDLQRERLWEVEGYEWVPLKAKSKSQQRREEEMKKDDEGDEEKEEQTETKDEKKDEKEAK